MRSVLCKAAVLTGSLALIFFCSCERHRPDELPAEEHAKSDAAGHERSEHAEKGKGHEKKHGDDQGRATTAMPVNPHGGPAPTPAEFFPEATPH